MRTLYIVRHAKSSWADVGMRDFDRPLNERGLHDAPKMARLFSARNEAVDLLVSSPANRAMTTARFFAGELGNAVVQEEQGIYLADVRTLMSIIGKLPDTANHVMIFGHNPGLSELVEHLADGRLGDLPTCAIVRIDLHVESWQEVVTGTGTIAWWDTPKRE